jgi:hypothetical protein
MADAADLTLSQSTITSLDPITPPGPAASARAATVRTQSLVSKLNAMLVLTSYRSAPSMPDIFGVNGTDSVPAPPR